MLIFAVIHLIVLLLIPNRFEYNANEDCYVFNDIKYCKVTETDVFEKLESFSVFSNYHSKLVKKGLMVVPLRLSLNDNVILKTDIDGWAYYINSDFTFPKLESDSMEYVLIKNKDGEVVKSFYKEEINAFISKSDYYFEQYKQDYMFEFKYKDFENVETYINRE